MTILVGNSSIKSDTTFKIGAFGDSISIAYNANIPGPNVEFSWVTGDAFGARVSSHRQRLQAVLPHVKISTYNFAANGAGAIALSGQIDRLGQTGLDYASLLVGSNDLIQWLGPFDQSLVAYGRYIKKACERLIALNERVMILLVSLPDQRRVLDLSNPWLKQQLGIGGGAAPLGSASDFFSRSIGRLYGERWQAANEVLTRITAEHKANVRLCESVSRVAFGPQHLSSLDRYHPSIAGQELLAKVTWSEGFFPG